LNYVGSFQGDITSRFLKVDFTRDEAMAYPLHNLPVRSTYSDLSNKENSLEEILAEKLRSLLTRTEPRDLYDIHNMLTNQMVDVETMVFSMAPKFTSKDFTIDDLKTILAKREVTFNQLWNGRLSGQVPEIPSLDTVIRETNRFFQQHF
jgi:predicted nucleotidyltransferase component of viral defense system